MLPAVVVLAVVLGLVVGAAVNSAAGAFPWGPRRGPVSQPEPVEDRGPCRGPVDVVERTAGAGLALPRPVLEVATAVLFALTAVRFGLAWDLPAFLYLAGVGVLLSVIDARHRLLPNRVVLPSYGMATGLLLLAAVATGEWEAFVRAGAGAVVLFSAFLVLALVSPAGMGMGDVKLAGLLGLYLGWLGWPTLVVGAAAGFVVQAVVSLVLLAFRRIGLRGELAFGPSMLAGAAAVIGLTSQGPLG